MMPNKLNISVGTKLQRLKGNKTEVVVLIVSDDYVTIEDANGRNFIDAERITDEFFTIIEPPMFHDNIPRTTNNLDDPDRHSISGSMNNPSDMQEYAFKEDEK